MSPAFASRNGRVRGDDTSRDRQVVDRRRRWCFLQSKRAPASALQESVDRRRSLRVAVESCADRQRPAPTRGEDAHLPTQRRRSGPTSERYPKSPLWQGPSEDCRSSRAHSGRVVAHEGPTRPSADRQQISSHAWSVDTRRVAPTKKKNGSRLCRPTLPLDKNLPLVSCDAHSRRPHAVRSVSKKKNKKPKTSPTRERCANICHFFSARSLFPSATFARAKIKKTKTLSRLCVIARLDTRARVYVMGM